MAKFEYTDSTIEIIIESDKPLQITNDIYIQLMRNLEKLNAEANLSQIHLTRTTLDEYDYKVETQDNLKIYYSFYRDNGRFTYKFSTEDTVWVPEVVVKNIELRETIMNLINTYEIHKIKIIYL